MISKGWPLYSEGYIRLLDFLTAISSEGDEGLESVIVILEDEDNRRRNAQGQTSHSYRLHVVG